MTCREAQSQMFTEHPVGRTDPAAASAFATHLASCSDCQRIRDELAAALTSWRTQVDTTPVPNAEREWHAVRRRIRGGAETNPKPGRVGLHWLAWLALPLGGAAAAAIALMIALPSSPVKTAEVAPPPLARVESVEAPGNNASTMVFVDDKSGWLIVWASDAISKSG